MEDKDIIIILGNGFDLDLGYETSYRKFYKNYFADNRRLDGDLKKFIRDKTLYCNWIDLEMALKEYVLGEAPNLNIETFLKEYKTIKGWLESFIRIQTGKCIREESYAYRLLQNITDFSRIRIYSFNYTSLDLNLNPAAKDSKDVVNIHGALGESNMIFGFDSNGLNWDYSPIVEAVKTTNTNSCLNEYFGATNGAKEIVIFGHSFGETDFGFYFKDIFKDQLYNQNRRITIVTYDDLSVRQLNAKIDIGMNGEYLNLIQFPNVDIICTDKIEDEHKFQLLLERLC